MHWAYSPYENALRFSFVFIFSAPDVVHKNFVGFHVFLLDYAIPVRAREGAREGRRKNTAPPAGMEPRISDNGGCIETTEEDKIAHHHSPSDRTSTLESSLRRVKSNSGRSQLSSSSPPAVGGGKGKREFANGAGRQRLC